MPRSTYKETYQGPVRKAWTEPHRPSPSVSSWKSSEHASTLSEELDSEQEHRTSEANSRRSVERRPVSSQAIRKRPRNPRYAPFGTHLDLPTRSTTKECYCNHGPQRPHWDDADIEIPPPPPSPKVPVSFHWLAVRNRSKCKKQNPNKHRETEYQRSMNQVVEFQRALLTKHKRSPFATQKAKSQHLSSMKTPFATLAFKPGFETEYMAMSAPDIYDRHQSLSET